MTMEEVYALTMVDTYARLIALGMKPEDAVQLTLNAADVLVATIAQRTQQPKKEEADE